MSQDDTIHDILNEYIRSKNPLFENLYIDKRLVAYEPVCGQCKWFGELACNWVPDVHPLAYMCHKGRVKTNG